MKILLVVLVFAALQLAGCCPASGTQEPDAEPEPEAEVHTALWELVPGSKRSPSISIYVARREIVLTDGTSIACVARGDSLWCKEVKQPAQHAAGAVPEGVVPEVDLGELSVGS